MTDKVCIGVVCPDYIATKTVGTLVSLMKKYPNLGVIIKQGCYVHKNREDVVLDAQKGGFTHLFFVDADMCFSPLVLQPLRAMRELFLYKFSNPSVFSKRGKICKEFVHCLLQNEVRDEGQTF